MVEMLSRGLAGWSSLMLGRCLQFGVPQWPLGSQQGTLMDSGGSFSPESQTSVPAPGHVSPPSPT